jgi:hypothetical protein
MLRKTCNKALALKYFNQTVHEDPLDKGWITITFYVRQNYQKHYSLSIKH